MLLLSCNAVSRNLLEFVPAAPTFKIICVNLCQSVVSLFLCAGWADGAPARRSSIYDSTPRARGVDTLDYPAAIADTSKGQSRLLSSNLACILVLDLLAVVGYYAPMIHNPQPVQLPWRLLLFPNRPAL